MVSAEQIKAVIARFVPDAMRENVFVKALLAGAAAIGILLMVPAFAPVGVVGAGGWIIVYVVAGGTLTYELVKAAWAKWTRMSPEQRSHLDAKLEVLKKCRDDGAITDEEYQRRARALLDDMLGEAQAAPRRP